MSAPPRNQLEALGLSTACADVLRHLWDYLDDQITPDSAERLQMHIVSCAQCQSYSDYQSCFLEAAARLRVELGAPDKLRERLADGLKTEGCRCWDQVQRAKSAS